MYRRKKRKKNLLLFFGSKEDTLHSLGFIGSSSRSLQVNVDHAHTVVFIANEEPVIRSDWLADNIQRNLGRRLDGRHCRIYTALMLLA